MTDQPRRRETGTMPSVRTRLVFALSLILVGCSLAGFARFFASWPPVLAPVGSLARALRPSLTLVPVGRLNGQRSAPYSTSQPPDISPSIIDGVEPAFSIDPALSGIAAPQDPHSWAALTECISCRWEPAFSASLGQQIVATAIVVAAFASLRQLRARRARRSAAPTPPRSPTVSPITWTSVAQIAAWGALLTCWLPLAKIAAWAFWFIIDGYSARFDVFASGIRGLAAAEFFTRLLITVLAARLVFAPTNTSTDKSALFPLPRFLRRRAAQPTYTPAPELRSIAELREAVMRPWLQPRKTSTLNPAPIVATLVLLALLWAWPWTQTWVNVVFPSMTTTKQVAGK